MLDTYFDFREGDAQAIRPKEFYGCCIPSRCAYRGYPRGQSPHYLFNTYPLVICDPSNVGSWAIWSCFAIASSPELVGCRYQKRPGQLRLRTTSRVLAETPASNRRLAPFPAPTPIALSNTVGGQWFHEDSIAAAGGGDIG